MAAEEAEVGLAAATAAAGTPRRECCLTPPLMPWWVGVEAAETDSCLGWWGRLGWRRDWAVDWGRWRGEPRKDGEVAAVLSCLWCRVRSCWVGDSVG